MDLRIENLHQYPVDPHTGSTVIYIRFFFFVLYYLPVIILLVCALLVLLWGLCCSSFKLSVFCLSSVTNVDSVSGFINS